MAKIVLHYTVEDLGDGSTNVKFHKSHDIAEKYSLYNLGKWGTMPDVCSRSIELNDQLEVTDTFYPDDFNPNGMEE